jgi:hypothetical protein
MLEKNTFLEELNAYAATEDILSVEREVKELKNKFSDFILEEERQHQIAQLKAQEVGKDSEKYYDAKNDTFFELYTQIRERQKEQRRIIKTNELEYLKQKQILLDKLKNVIENEENIGEAYNALHEINDKWKTIGEIPREKRQEIQQEYSRLRELFSYNIKIYKELKEHDLHRNKQLKEKLIEKLSLLIRETGEKSLKEIETGLKTLQEEWEDIGPTLQADWDKLKEDYWTRVKNIYDIIRNAHEAKKEELVSNIENKKALIEKAKELLNNTADFQKHSAWQKSTEQLISLQEEWKKIGFGTKKENEQVWAEFRAICDQFFEQKKVFYDEKKGDYDAVKLAKEAIILDIEPWLNSTDWKTATEKIISFQNKWKNAGSAGPKHDQKLWTTFRQKCDQFFNAKKAFFESREQENNENTHLKEAIIAKIESYAPKADKKESLADLKALIGEYNSVGNVPNKEKERVHQSFKTAIHKQYEALDVKDADKDKIFFQLKLDTLQADPQAEKLLEQERKNLRHEMSKIKSEIMQLENNLGFFGRSKGADALKKEVENKVLKLQENLKKLEIKLKMLGK